jgi:branched-chain amino acid transport system ATP-binding protein
MAMLAVNDLVVKYGSILALRGVTVDVAEGEAVGVIGPNGAGKSTMLNAIANAIAISEGDIQFQGKSIFDISRSPREVHHDWRDQLADWVNRGRRARQRLRPDVLVKAGISLVPEGREIFHRLTVGENLRLGTTVRRDKDEVAADMEWVHGLFPILKEYDATPAGKLSGGEQQMLAIARALLTRPKLLMLDEPSLGLAPIMIDRVFETLEQLRETGMTILLVEQNAARTLDFVDRAYVLRTGEIELKGTPAELQGDPAFEEAFLGFV